MTSQNDSQFMDEVITQVLPDTLVPVFGWLAYSFGGRRWQRPSVGGSWEAVTPRDCSERDSTTNGGHSGRGWRINAECLVHAEYWVVVYSCRSGRRSRRRRSGSSGGCRRQTTVRRVLQRRADRTVRAHTTLPVPDDFTQKSTVLNCNHMTQDTRHCRDDMRLITAVLQQSAILLQRLCTHSVGN